ncbi:unnamed protein product [Rangifer tarandus platyrhynchus]|uniref:Uncharacterized protein n=1 Tax=Rangifer tarandus platyrhynchus TaxID=3082113 RepID=A0ABN8YAP9_RANTA|nr:unnamed protein product [Rangifer tarandus platyrhynchus]
MLHLHIWGSQDIKPELMPLSSLNREKMVIQLSVGKRSKENILIIKTDLRSRIERYQEYTFSPLHLLLQRITKGWLEAITGPTCFSKTENKLNTAIFILL